MQILTQDFERKYSLHHLLSYRKTLIDNAASGAKMLIFT